jgi:cytosine/adenosine deaminase-related metal-dependent hydrolase
VLRSRRIFVEGRRIAGVTEDRPAPTDTVIGGPDQLVLPGFVNLHTHALNAPLLRGVIDDLGGDASAGNTIYSTVMPLGNLAARLLEDDELTAVTELGLLELLKGGSTTVVDMWRAERPVFPVAARAVGIRAYGCPYVASRRMAGVDGSGRGVYEPASEPDGGLARAVQLIQGSGGGGEGRVRLMLGPHGADTCDPPLLRGVREAAGELDCPISIHLAQSRRELADLQRRYGKTPAEYLEAAGLLGPDLLAAHCVYSTDADLALMRRTGAAIASCPMVYARGGDGAAFHRFTAHGVRTGIGTDSICMDLLRELHAAGMVSKLAAGRADVATAWELVAAATAGGADILGRPDLGRIEAGALADLLVVDLGRPHLQPVRDPIRNLVWNASGADIAGVVVDGEVLVRDGVYVRGDERAIARRAAAAVAKVWQRAEVERILPRAGAPDGHGGE